MTALRVLAWLPAAIWVYLILLRGRFWLPTIRLPRAAAAEEWPSVAVVIPARNEAELVGHTLPTVLAQQYRGRAEVFLVDDSSDAAPATWPAPRPDPISRARYTS